MKKRRILALVLAAMMLLTLLAGCKKSDDTQDNTDPKGGDPKNGGANGTDATELVDDRPEYIWHATFKNMDMQLEYVDTCTRSGDKFYLSGSYITGKETYTDPETNESYDYDTYENGIFVMNTDGTDMHKLEGLGGLTASGGDEVDGGSNIQRIAASADGTLWILEYVYQYNFDLPENFDETTMEKWDYFTGSEEVYNLHKLDKDGQELLAVEAKSLVETDENDPSGDYFWVNDMKVDKAGNVYLFMESKCLVLNENCEKVAQISADPDNGVYFYNTLDLPDGRFGVMSYDPETGDPVVMPLDVEKQALGDPITMPQNAYQIYPGSGDYDFYYMNGTSLMGYKSGTDESEEIFNFVNIDVDSSNMTVFSPLEDGTFVGLSTTYNYSRTAQRSTNTTEYFKIELVPSSTVPLKRTLTLACMWMDYNIRRQLISFNKSSDKYHIDVVDYSQYNTEEDYTAGQTKLITEVLSGKVPDLMTTDNMPIARFAAKGLLEDLWPYIDSDTALGGRSGVVEPFFNAMSEDGKLYQLSPGFTIQTVAGPTMLVGDRITWTINDLLDAYSQMPEGADIFSANYTKDSALQTVCYMMMDDFVDWETGECHFDSDDFVGILKFADLFPAEFDWDNYNWDEDYESDAQRFRSGKQMLSQLYMYDFSDWQYQEAMMGTPISFIGYPVASGIGSAFAPQGGLAMSSTCADKEGAWEFLSGFLSEDYQDQYVYNFPSNKAVFDRRLEEASTPQYYTDPETGEQKEQSRGGYWIDDGTTVEVYALTQEQVDKVMTLINATERLYSYDETIYNVISDECGAFFAGQKSAEETAKLVQSRLNIYVNEKR